MPYDESLSSMVNENYWNNQEKKISNFLIEQGMNESAAKTRAHQCIIRKISYNDFISMQGNVYKFENNSIRAKEEEKIEVPVKNNIKKKKLNIPVIKKIIAGALIITFVGVSYGAIKDYKTIKSSDEFGELATNIVKAQYEQQDNIRVVDDISDKYKDMADNFISRNKQLEYDGYNQPEVTVDYEGVCNDILALCSEHPEFLDSIMFSIYNDFVTVGIEDQNPSNDVITSNQLYQMDEVIKTIKPLAEKEGYTKISERLSDVNTMPDLMMKNISSDNNYSSIVNEYNEISKNTSFDYSYSHLSDTKDMDKLIKEYKNTMYKHVANQIDDVNAYYEQMDNNGMVK